MSMSVNVNEPAAIVAKITEELGPLVANYQEYESLFKAIRSGEHAHDIVPSVLPRMIRQESWMKRYDRNAGKPYILEAREFIRFIEEKPPVGLGTTIDTIRGYLQDGGQDRLAFEVAIDRGRGNPVGRKAAPRENDGTFSSIPNSVRVNGEIQPEPVLIPINPPPDRPERDRSGEPQAGNSLGYAVRRLGRERPDLLDKVKVGELSPNAAMVQAGFRKPPRTLPLDVESAVRLIVKHFQGEALNSLIRGLANWAGIRLVEGDE